MVDILLFWGFIGMIAVIVYSVIYGIVYVGSRNDKKNQKDNAQFAGFFASFVMVPFVCFFISQFNLMGPMHYTYTEDVIPAGKMKIYDATTYLGEKTYKITRNDVNKSYSTGIDYIVENAPVNKVVYFTGCKYDSEFIERIFGCHDEANNETKYIRVERFEILGTVPSF